MLDAVDLLAGQGLFANDKVLIQSGNNPDFQALHCQQQSFLSADQFVETIKDASIVISHAGAGTLIHSLRAGKTPVVIPRRKEYGEHVDNHQCELLEALVDEGRVVPAYDVQDLPAAIEQVRKRTTKPIPAQPCQMIKLVAKAICELGRR